MIRILKRGARSSLKPVAALADRVARPPRGLTVLIYHRVGAASGGEVDLDVDRFRDQMQELATSGRAVSLDHGLAYLAGNDIGITEPVAVTFDDGTPDVFEHALPILDDLAIPMTLYLATRYLDEGMPFWDDADPVLSWPTVRDALSSPTLTIGSHTHSHALLDRLEPHLIDDELDQSIRSIEDNLGVTPAHFAYPKALPPNEAAAVAVRARFSSAALAGTRANPVGADPFALARSPIQRSDGMRWFRHKLDGGLGLEDRVRGRINRRRYVQATS